MIKMADIIGDPSRIVASVSSESLSWQQEILKQSQYFISLDGGTKNDNSANAATTAAFPNSLYQTAAGDGDGDDVIEWFFPMDNTSVDQCRSCLFHQCPGVDDKPLWWLVLRWLKMIVLKVARSYHAKPIVLVIAPLTIGLIVGYWFGFKHTHQQQQQQKQQHTSHIKTTTTTTMLNISVGDSTTMKRISILISQFQSFIMILTSTIYWIVLGSILSKFNSTFRNSRRSQGLEDETEEISTTKDLCTTSEDICQTSSCSTSSTKYVNNKIQITSTTRNEMKVDDNKRMNNSNVNENKDDDNDEKLKAREDRVRTNLLSDIGCTKESGIDKSHLPKHIAVIMDGNRRYGKAKYGSSTRGHWDGSSKLVEFAKWCIAEEIQILTVYAFSTENWNRDPSEVASLMAIFAKYCEELRIEALKRNIKVIIQSTDPNKIPDHVQSCIKRLVEDTANCNNGLLMNICMSYGSRNEIVNATRSLALDAVQGILDPTQISCKDISDRLVVSSTSDSDDYCCDPDVLIRSGSEQRISNFLLWQIAYTELFFLSKPWPAIEKEDLLHVIRTYAKQRRRRFGR